jgi:hypothetical protein
VVASRPTAGAVGDDETDIVTLEHRKKRRREEGFVPHLDGVSNRNVDRRANVATALDALVMVACDARRLAGRPR